MNDLENLLAEIGVEDIYSRGEEVQARCPMHRQRTGKLEVRPKHWSINRESGAHYCFSCGYKGSLVTLITDLTQKSPWEARKLIRAHRLDFAAWAGRIAAVAQNLDDDRYESSFIDLTERLECFADPPGSALRQRGLQRAAVTRYGLRWDLDEGAWVLPIRGPYGDVWGYQTKSRDRVLNHPSGVRKSRTLFGLDLLLEQPPAFRDYVILVESPLDVVYVDGWGYPAVASFGCLVSDRQLRLLIRYFDRFILALDNDDAGRREMKRILKTDWAKKRPVEILNYRRSKAKDPGELTEGEFIRAVETARSGLWFR